MTKLHFLFVLVLCFTAEPIFAEAFDINLNNDSARLSYVAGSSSRAEMEFGYLFNEDDYKLPHFGIHITDSTGDQSRALKMSLGGRIYALFNDPIEIFAVGLGGGLIFTPGIAFDRLRFHISAHYSPDVVTFGDGDILTEYSAALEYQILTRGFVYLGFRQIKVDFGNGGNVDVDEGGHLGLKIAF